MIKLIITCSNIVVLASPYLDQKYIWKTVKDYFKDRVGGKS